MSAHFDPALKACAVLGRFLHHRGLVLVAEPLRPGHVSEADLDAGFTPPTIVNGILESLGSWQVVAARAGPGPPALVYVVVVTGGNDAAHKAKSMSALLQQGESRAAESARAAGLLGPAGAGAGLLREMIVIAPDDVVLKKPLQAVFAAANSARGAHYQLLPYIKFSVAVPECAAVPAHSVASPEEVAEYLRVSMIPAGQLPLIPRDDAAVVWCGALPGQFVRVMRPSETVATYVPVYRLVR